MTIEEAREKWCSQVRFWNLGSGVGINAEYDDRAPRWARCIGPDCALWRSFAIRDQDTADYPGECGLIQRTPLSQTI